MNLREIVEKLREIKGKGFVPSLRRGSTGVGFTFERWFGLTESNIPIPDIGGRVEIKTVRKDSQSLITLFTFNRGVWQIKQKDLIMRYGYLDEQGRYALKNTLFYRRPIPQGLSLDIDESKNIVELVDLNTQEVLAIWDIYVIVGKFLSKLSRILFILAERKMVGHQEYFHFDEAYLLMNPSSRRFLEAFRNSMVGIDLRMHLKDNGGVRNRGTAFRIKENNLINLYEDQRRLI